MRHRCDICVLGGGVTARLVAGVLSSSGQDVILVVPQIPNAGGLNRLSFDILPVFAAIENPLWTLIPDFEIPADFERLRVKKVPGEDGCFGEKLAESAAPTAFARFLRANGRRTNDDAVLAMKHVGIDNVLGHLPLLEEKVLRKYDKNSVSGFYGYSDGRSPYQHVVDALPQPRLVLRKPLRAITSSGRVVLERSSVEFDRAISSMPYWDLFALTGVKHQVTKLAADAAFSINYTSSRIELNQLTYDARAESPIFRYFAPDHGVVVAQLANSHSYQARNESREALETLGNFEISHSVSRLKVWNSCYPLSISNREGFLKSILALEDAGILSFGRFAQWEYKDVHELDWNRVHELL